jgi:hypothetical protein
MAKGPSAPTATPVAATSPPPPPPVTQPPPSSPPTAAPALSIAAMPKSDNVLVKVESTPPKADVFLDGQKLGPAPGPFELPRKSERVKLVVKADGFKPASIDVDTSANANAAVALTRIERPRAPAGGTKKAGTPTSDIPTDINE